jgi:hypothetical protein
LKVEVFLKEGNVAEKVVNVPHPGHRDFLHYLHLRGGSF